MAKITVNERTCKKLVSPLRNGDCRWRAKEAHPSGSHTCNKSCCYDQELGKQFNIRHCTLKTLGKLCQQTVFISQFLLGSLFVRGDYKKGINIVCWETSLPWLGHWQRTFWVFGGWCQESSITNLSFK